MVSFLASAVGSLFDSTSSNGIRLTALWFEATRYLRTASSTRTVRLELGAEKDDSAAPPTSTGACNSAASQQAPTARCAEGQLQQLRLEILAWPVADLCHLNSLSTAQLAVSRRLELPALLRPDDRIVSLSRGIKKKPLPTSLSL
eukprot:m.2784 g.2784  ORF g.2784 m.2784 type:complete len:145 (-) comp3177_c0_seq1:916-1350(-)